jgi:hypothetical protein
MRGFASSACLSAGTDHLPAIRFQTEDPQGRHVRVYDLDSGVLLHAGSAVSGRISGSFTQELRPGTSGMLSQSTFVGARQVTLPWMQGTPPPWLATLQALRYEGTTTVYIPGSPAFPFPVALTAQTVAQGGRWLLLRAIDLLASVPAFRLRKAFIPDQRHRPNGRILAASGRLSGHSSPANISTRTP